MGRQLGDPPPEPEYIRTVVQWYSPGTRGCERCSVDGCEYGGLLALIRHEIKEFCSDEQMDPDGESCRPYCSGYVIYHDITILCNKHLADLRKLLTTPPRFE